MIFVIKTPTSKLRSGDKVYVVGSRKPVVVEYVNENNVRCRQANGKRLLATQKEFERVVMSMNEVIR